jgi:hypothetical protein
MVMPPTACRRIALAAVEHLANPALAPFGRRHPGSIDPRRMVPDVLAMSAGEIGHPISLFVLVQGDNGAIHAATS